MRENATLVLLGVLCLASGPAFAENPRHDRAVFVEVKDEFKQRLEARASKEERQAEDEKELKMDLTGLDLPASVKAFEAAWYFPPISQDLTGSCWAFSSISFFESEIHRLSGRELKLSEMYTVYWEFVEKARRFVRERGESVFARGSQANATPRIWKEYGIVPAEAYGAPDSPDAFYDDREMFFEMKAYLKSVSETRAWNEEEVLAIIRSILDRHMGSPPTMVAVDDREMTPFDYFKNVVRLDLDDYVDLMSLQQAPYYAKAEYPVADNWWHSEDYLNVPLDDFMAVIEKAIRRGYTVCMAGDNSEAGFYPPLDVAVVPSFDIPSDFIDDSARQFRFSNGSTTDDHVVHLVGYLEKDGKDWYLIKDSYSEARMGEQKGYMFYHEDFVRLKMMNILVHRDVAEGLLVKSGGSAN